ncbi:TPA: hypothetical protein ACG4ML_004471 [Stenotrophomonas maltophilia]|jgi:hypothetical protein|nr:hypothetical protein [Stenotrophomonas maltophilia]HEL3849107.1 hypothetical protein [Stenotrophomonas maltophilia]HEL4294567.1 hypothetical protein [Stenotrophomonas maltophilia]
MQTITGDAEEIHLLESKAVQHLSLLAVAAVDRLMGGPDDGNSSLDSINHSLLCLVQECNEHSNRIAKAAGAQSTSPQTQKFRWQCIESAVQFVDRASSSAMRAEIENGTARLRSNPEFDPADLVRRTTLSLAKEIISRSERHH